MASGASSPTVTVVLCRHDESVRWAVDGLRGVTDVDLIIYNNGPPLGIPQERLLRNVGREAFCYLTHMLDVLSRGEEAIANYTIFSQASPTFANGRGQILQGRHGETHIVHMAKQLAAAAFELVPRGFANMWGMHGAPRGYGAFGLPFMSWNTPPLCFRSEWERLLQTRYGWDWAHDRQLLYTPTAQFVVARENLWKAPRGWMRRAWLAHALVSSPGAA